MSRAYSLIGFKNPSCRTIKTINEKIAFNGGLNFAGGVTITLWLFGLAMRVPECLRERSTPMK